MGAGTPGGPLAGEAARAHAIAALRRAILSGDLAPGQRLVEQELAATLGVTHSAASQTVAQLIRHGLVVAAPGADARQRVLRLTPAAESLLPALELEWTAATAAARAFEAELPYPLSRLIADALAALDGRPMRDRIAGEIDRINAAAGPRDPQVPANQDDPADPDPA